MTKSAESNTVDIGQTLVNLGHGLETESTILNDPLNLVNTHHWSKLGKRVGQNPGQTPMSLISLQNFCRFQQI
jgi:hypothetical protein